MMAAREIRGTARIDIHAGKLDELKRLVERCVDIVKTHDPGTIEYAIYLDEPRMRAFVHERYRDSEAGLAHMKNIADVAAEMSKICTITGEVCGSPSPELRKALEEAGVTIYTPLAAR